jgi:hypothetical protein
MSRIATHESTSVSLAELRRDHDVVDLVHYYEAIQFCDEARRPQEGDS